MDTLVKDTLEPTVAAIPGSEPPIRVDGKFFRAGFGAQAAKHFVKGVTYGPFAPGSHGAQFPEAETVDRDFAMMLTAGINTVRVFTVPPVWLLDTAAAHGLKVLVGLPWSEHVTFLDDTTVQAGIRDAVAGGVRACARHKAVFAYLVGNEIPPDIIRWHGPKRIENFVKGLVELVKREHPGALVSYANFPSTEYLDVASSCDFLCFNVYLHDETAFRRYIARLQNLTVTKPLVLTEFGADSLRSSKEEQRDILSWHIKAAFAGGAAGTFVFAWTDEWFTGGHPIEDWDFGLVDRQRKPKPAFTEVKAQYLGPLPPPLKRYPRVSVVVCAYNAERTMDKCLASLEHLNYPDYEVIVVNDGSKDRTLTISESYPNCRIISQENKGLSVARNVGAEAATGEIVAYTDSDCVADPDWLNYLVGTMETKGLVACGGPNFPPPEDELVPEAVAVSPGAPCHVLLDDEIAEHIAGCNMAFRREVLLGIGGFDSVFRAAGDDVDICWRLRDAGHVIGYSAAAFVWHFRRNTVKAYIGQQKGYGKAEALVSAKHPARFNAFGQAKWSGRIYGDLSSSMLLWRRPAIYAGTFGRGLFQTLYQPPAGELQYLPLTFEWMVASIPLALIGVAAGRGWWLLTLPLLLTWAMCVKGGLSAPIDERFDSLKARALVALLIYLGPLLRGWERIRWRVKGLPPLLGPDPAQPEQRGRPDWRRRGFVLSYWSETGTEKEAVIGALMRRLAAAKLPLALDTGWSDWDIAIEGNLAATARVTIADENHGADKRLLRVRSALRPTLLTRWVFAGLAALALASLLGHSRAGLALCILAVIGAGGLFCWQAVVFGGRIHRLIEAAAREVGLTPVNLIARQAQPVSPPRTA
ncbi:MAG TPA: glycosyltransferase [Stellaceae bacterium]|nr:glycosyltransferase [Stellaceae bacterium]